MTLQEGREDPDIQRLMTQYLWCKEVLGLPFALLTWLWLNP